ncbi:MAG: glycosyltransferase family 4 protein [Bacillota bacterium]
MPGKKLSSKYHLPLITRFQGTILKDFKDTRLQRIRKFNHYKALELKSDMIIMTDDGTEGDKVLQRLGNKTEKIFFWKNGQDIPLNESFFDTRNAVRDQLEISRTAPVLLTVSRLQNWKRVDRAINAMPDVLKRFPDCKLVIVGGGEEYENLKSLAEKTGVQDSVIFTGPVEQKDVWKYYSCADIFLSLYDLSNLGNPLMEAMRYGKAIITLNIGETYKVIENEVNGILLKQEPFDVSSAIVRLLTDKKLKNMLGENAKEYAKRNFWSWEERMKAEVDAVNALREDF